MDYHTKGRRNEERVSERRSIRQAEKEEQLHTWPQYQVDERELDQQHGHSIGNVDIHDAARAHVGDNYITNHYHGAARQQSDYEPLLASLTYDRMDARFHNVATALPMTCDWLLRHPDFLAWIDDDRLDEHRGFLWVKGKPGSGKSTIMKETLTWAGQAWSGQLIISYFFNARSPHPLEKSSLGLYRSLLYQLLCLLPSARAPFAAKFASKVRRKEVVEAWTEIELQNFLVQLIRTPQRPPIIMFVDALDEGEDDDTRQMVKFLELLTQSTATIACPLRVCLSSRHYPHITVSKSRSLIVENQLGHGRDIDLYIRSQLPGNHSPRIDNLRRMIRRQSAGVFLWVVLVVRLLTKAYDQGRDTATMLRQLTTIPPDLHNTFAQILPKDPDDFNECITLLQWVLYSKRPLSPIELYHAVQYSCSQIRADESSVVALDVATRYLLNCSRGLVELTNAKDPVVQFIHETVRDYLTSGNLFEQGRSRPPFSNLSEQDFGFETCNGKLSEVCLNYMLQSFNRFSSTQEMVLHYPLTSYAAEYWWQHLQSGPSPSAGREVDLALELLTGRRSHLLLWTQLCALERSYPITVDDLAPPLYYAAFIDRQELVSGILAAGADVNARGGLYTTALHAASARGCERTVQTLLGSGADINAQGRYDFSALHEASRSGHEKVVQILLDRGADIKYQARYCTALMLAAEKGHEKVVQILLDGGADVNARGGDSTALQRASELGHEKIVQILVNRGAHVDPEERYCPLPDLALLKGYDEAVQMLLNQEVDAEACGEWLDRLLYEASSKGDIEVVWLLLDRGANVDAEGGRHGRALDVASWRGRENVVRILLDEGADVNGQGEWIGPALNAAALGGNENITRMLLDQGARVNAQGHGRWMRGEGTFSTALAIALLMDHKYIVQILLERGAKTNDEL